LKEIEEDEPKIKALIRREFSQLPAVSGAARQTFIPEATAIQKYRRTTIDRCLDVLTVQQKSLWKKQLEIASRHY
jgi:hypothetical protein